jgi:hypothetical protein
VPFDNLSGEEILDETLVIFAPQQALLLPAPHTPTHIHNWLHKPDAVSSLEHNTTRSLHFLRLFLVL